MKSETKAFYSRLVRWGSSWGGEREMVFLGFFSLKMTRWVSEWEKRRPFLFAHARIGSIVLCKILLARYGLLVGRCMVRSSAKIMIPRRRFSRLLRKHSRCWYSLSNDTRGAVPCQTGVYLTGASFPLIHVAFEATGTLVRLDSMNSQLFTDSDE